MRAPAMMMAIALAGVAAPAAAQDDLQLEGMSVIGNQELPRALYIVPWKRPELGEADARPLGSLIDEVLAPVDREVFLREMEYYEAGRSGD